MVMSRKLLPHVTIASAALFFGPFLAWLRRKNECMKCSDLPVVGRHARILGEHECTFNRQEQESIRDQINDTPLNRFNLCFYKSP
jgi:hypothetical protein